VPADGSTARTGTNGKVVVEDTLVARITQWVMNATSSETAWGDSDSEGYTNRSKARLDATGSMVGKFDEDSKVYDLFMPGDIVELVLFETEDDYWALPRALIQTFNVTYNQDTKEVVEWNADWGADGKYYRPGQDGAPSHTLP